VQSFSEFLFIVPGCSLIFALCIACKRRQLRLQSLNAVVTLLNLLRRLPARATREFVITRRDMLTDRRTITFRHAMRKRNPNIGPLRLEAAQVAEGNETARKIDTLSDLIPMVQDVRLRKTLQMIESYPPRTIHDLALECNLSYSRLQHLFKQHTGFGLGQILTEQRMQQAIGLLIQTNRSIKEIASTLGYEHASSFTRAFERRFQQTPSCYRQEQSPQEALRKASMASPVRTT
jgi:AraC-like DNA-binding protein